jgi:hypothetical protein
MTTLITTTNNSMPKVSYVKGLDVFLNFCFVMVFVSSLSHTFLISHIPISFDRLHWWSMPLSAIGTNGNAEEGVDFAYF